MTKFNTKVISYWLLLIGLFGLLIYTRFINIGWSLPYPMHPDERNMAIAIQGLNCDLRSCFNPHFFAYGQFPLYLGYLITWLFKFFDGDLGTPVSFIEAVFSLRIISAIASIINAYIIFKVIGFIIANFQYPIFKKFSTFNFQLVILLIIFCPFFIQFSHFGTTESLLMLFFSVIVYLSLLLINNKINSSKFIIFGSLISGLAIATKISSLIFLFVPLLSIVDLKLKTQNQKPRLKIKNFIILCLIFSLSSLVFGLFFSPHNLINWSNFITTIKYESAVALGKYSVFYTKQFIDTTPVLFQATKIFPYALDWPIFIFFIFGFLFLPWKKEINLLRIAFLVYFIPMAFLFAKWTRFMAPILPIMLILAVIFLIFFISNIKNQSRFNRDQISKIFIKNQIFLLLISNFTFCILIFALILPGIAYLSIYQNLDVRFQASDWIYKNIPSNSYILSETANVVDIPIEVKSQKSKVKSFRTISFDFYELDSNPRLQEELKQHLKLADYIIIPSRRIFMNHTCLEDQKSNIKNQKYNSKIKNNKCHLLEKKYPQLNTYYQNLFNGRLGFSKLAEFSSYPKIQLFGKILIEFPDEQAEETLTVFDHPVIRIFKKTPRFNLYN